MASGGQSVQRGDARAAVQHVRYLSLTLAVDSSCMRECTAATKDNVSV